MRRLLRLLYIAAIGTVAAFAHEVLTHQNIGDVAVAYLQQVAPNNRPSLPSLQQLLRIGAVQEDNDPLPNVTQPDRIGRFYFHFLPALNFTAPLISLGATCGSINWGLQGLSCTAVCQVPGICSISAIETNQHTWSNNLAVDSVFRFSVKWRRGVFR
jgi:hypothetical protein